MIEEFWIYCGKCKKQTLTINLEDTTKEFDDGFKAYSGKCEVCGINRYLRICK